MAVSLKEEAWTDKNFEVPLASDKPAHISELGKIAEDYPEFQDGLEEEFVNPVPASAQSVVDQIQPQPETIQEDQPEVIQVEGGSITIEKEKNGYKATLESEEGGGKEVFRGKTKNELMTNVLAGKLNATKQIRKLNRKIKLGEVVTPSPSQVVIEQPAYQPKQLTANDIFEIKTEIANDPDKALEAWFQKKFGLSATQLVALAHSANDKATKGQEAYEELSIESVSKEFLELHKDDYYPWEENASNLMSWLCKNKLHRNVVKGKDSFAIISAELLSKNLYTLENLEEALEDLKDSGLLVPGPQAEKPVAPSVPQVTPVKPVTQEQSSPTERIVRQTRQPRGGLGIRPSVASVNAQPISDKAPSGDDFENMSSEEISKHFADVRKYVLNQNRR